MIIYHVSLALRWEADFSILLPSVTDKSVAFTRPLVVKPIFVYFKVFLKGAWWFSEGFLFSVNSYFPITSIFLMISRFFGPILNVNSGQA